MGKLEFEAADASGLRLLSLDGGGVRGLSSLMVLSAIMNEYNKNSDVKRKPCEVFDLIGGTSTGGLIAVMLGHLQMDVDECITAYVEMSKAIFSKKNRSSWNLIGKAIGKVKADGKFNTAEFEKVIKSVIARSRFQNADASFQEDEDPKCKVFVCVTRAENSTRAVLRNYKPTLGIEASPIECKIWEACRATSAATMYFDPVAIGQFGEKYVDGGAGRNNPVYAVYDEAKLIFPNAVERIQCLISIGTGQQIDKAYGTTNLTSVLKSVVKMVTETEETARQFAKDHKKAEGNWYFRFNVRGLDDVSLEEYKKISDLAARSRTYLSEVEVGMEIRRCKEALMKNDIHYIPQGPNFAQINDEFTRQFSHIRDWIQPPFCDSDLATMRGKRTKDTCTWILDREEFKVWNGSSSGLLWAHGKAGCGKSVLAAFLIDYFGVQRKEAKTSKQPQTFHLGYAFCNNRHADFQDSLTIMKILVWQIIQRKDLHPLQKWEILEAWKTTSDTKAFGISRIADKSKSEPLTALVLQRLFKTLISRYESVMLVVDGMDECQNGSNELLRWLKDASSCERPRFKTIMLSRYEGKIAEMLGPQLEESALAIKPEDSTPDIETFLEYSLQLPASVPSGLESLMRQKILERADGMFLWVTLALNDLKAISAFRPHTLTEGRIVEAIERIPRRLNDLYLSVLERLFNDASDELTSNDAKEARKAELWLVLKLVIWSHIPMKPVELETAVEFQLSEFKTASSDGSWIQNFIQKYCSPLLLIQADGSSITSNHSTLRGFMEDDLPSRESFGFKHIHQLPKEVQIDMASLALNYLQLEEFKDVIGKSEVDLETMKNHKTLPLWYYSQVCWIVHAVSSGGGNTRLMEMIDEFFRSKQAVCWFDVAFRTLDVGDLMDLRNAMQVWAGEHDLGDWLTQLVVRSRQEREEKLGPDNDQTQYARCNAAVYFTEMGEYNEARLIYQDALKYLTESTSCGPSHPNTLSIMTGLAQVDVTLGFYQEAEELLTSSMEVDLKSASEQTPSIAALSRMHSLVILYRRTGKLEEALALGKTTVEVAEQTLGYDHPDLLIVKETYANVLRSLGDYNAAMELHEEVLKISSERLFDDHPVTIAVRGELALTAQKKGLIARAEREFRIAVDTFRRAFGTKNANLTHIQNLGGLGGCLIQLKKFDEAESCLVEALEISREVLGEENPTTLATIGDISTLYMEQGRFSEAEEIRRDLLELFAEVAGPNHTETLTSMGNLAYTLGKQDRHDEALALEEDVLKRTKEKLGPKHPDTLDSMRNLAYTYESLSRVDEAISLLKDEVQLREDIGGYGDLNAIVARSCLDIMKKKHGRV
ncbi:hypothetical protein BJ508DRAFT_168366 [Ascobolus immersus RN42]|uniref:PNPLA domain-containing protein n=1 Tax=Ascobolus immersus RN42 TaxID=1160509 RepID=A0A3N4INV5_ASCIM|nr:hypothetical protein BJ508DRAFT_168366 [Ascobolus immersus RN42]